MSKLSINDIIETTVNHNIYIKKIDSLFSFSGNDDLTIYREVSKFDDLSEYDIPIYRNKKTTAKWSVLNRESLTIKIDYTDKKGGFAIRFDANDPDSISILMKAKPPSVMKSVYVSKKDFSGNDSAIENPFDLLNKPKPPKFKFKEQDPVVKFILCFYNFLVFSLFFLSVKMLPMLGSLNNTLILITSVIFTIAIHFKTKDIIMFFANKHLDEIKKLIYN